MIVTMIHRSDLRIRSKADALKFYEGVKACTLIPYTKDGVLVLRVEPNNCISVVSKIAISHGDAWMWPSTHDTDGSIAYRYRKVINAYLARECITT